MKMFLRGFELGKLSGRWKIQNAVIAIVIAAGLNAGIGAAALAADIPAQASVADLAARPYTKAPALVSPAVDWSGFYIGGDVGWSNAQQNGTRGRATRRIWSACYSRHW